MEKIEILGLIAASLTTAAFIPQVYKAWKYKSTKDISIVMYLILLIGLFLWIIYGIYHRSIPNSIYKYYNIFIGNIDDWVKNKNINSSFFNVSQLTGANKRYK